MNTVQELRKVLSEEVLRLQPQAGLEARVLQQALRSSETVNRTHRSGRRGVTHPWVSEAIPTPRLMALVAALLAVLIVVSLVLAARALHSTPIVPAHPGPPPTTHAANGLIAVSANPWSVDGGEVGDIYLFSEGAAARRIIGSGLDGVAQACPRFSPDGRWLAYGEARASDPVTTFRGMWPVSNRAVVVVGINDRGDASPPIMRVKLPVDPGEIACPEWSPSGTQVAFRAETRLWVTDTGSGKTTVFPVTQAPWGQQEFEWSRDGSVIAVAESGRIRLVSLHGGASTLVPVRGATPFSLGWTAGDASIVYVSSDVLPDALAGELHRVGVGANNDAKVAPDAANHQLAVYGATVSPDGTRVAYLLGSYPCRGCNQDRRLMTMGIDGSNLVELPIPANLGVHGLQWSPDGDRLLFGSTGGVVSVDVAPGLPAIVYSGRELNLEWSASEVTWQPVFP